MIKLMEVNKFNSHHINSFNGEFIVKSKLILDVTDDGISYTVEPVKPYKKRYEDNLINPDEYINNSERQIFFALFDNNFAGQIILRRNWNQYAYVEDICVDVQYRKMHIGERLISTAIKWAKEKELAGIVLETQNNNVTACKFYESCDFEIGGFDKYLYKGIDADTDEIAIYWYYFL